MQLVVEPPMYNKGLHVLATQRLLIVTNMYLIQDHLPQSHSRICILGALWLASLHMTVYRSGCDCTDCAVTVAAFVFQEPEQDVRTIQS